MIYSIETRRIHTAGHWLTLNCDRTLATALALAQDAAIELERETRVVSYGKTFRVNAEFSATGQPLRDAA